MGLMMHLVMNTISNQFCHCFINTLRSINNEEYLLYAMCKEGCLIKIDFVTLNKNRFFFLLSKYKTHLYINLDSDLGTQAQSHQRLMNK